ncbi:hypothetical protein OS189_08535 [Sulfitobacter sp. F26169L]|uniref:hypothetical protein n=1 Tax=Sulfitobacter sp. F26169L TaxID=2996015 RepID=UPI002260E67E|nr:hypothetical protein [Sulfitobacter sp. F26169L]MCX7566387.1 hypothetical protein [Sulfitobacter sp. F26169L]
MKPNFALSLSFEGIKLLHRAAGGWREVGEVSVTSEDLAGELAVLRKTAASLEPGGVRSKLIIPDSQIKYLTIETIGLSEAARRRAAENALHDATPYAVSELAYDISLDGAKTHIAAVAQETLVEAEAFATEHRFHPVSFVAMPGDVPYLGEPFFGPAAGAADLLAPDETVESDGIAVVIVGSNSPESETAPEPDVQEEPVAKPPPPQPEPTPKPEPAVDQAPAPEPERPQAPAQPAPPQDAPSPKPATPAPVEQKTADAEPVATAAPSAAKPEREAELPLDLPSVEPAEPAKTNTPVPAEKPATAAADPATDATPAVAKPAPLKDPTPPASTTAPQQSPAQADTPDSARARAMAAAAAVVAPSKPTIATAHKKPTEPAPSTAAPTTTFSSRRAPAAAPAATGPSTAKPLGGAQRATSPTPAPDSSSLTQQPAAIADETTPPTSKIAGFLSRRKPRTGAAAPLPAPTARVASAHSEAERMTVFGARAEHVGGKPRFLGLIMTVILLVFLAGVAAWAAVFLDEGIAGLMRGDKGRATASAPENQIDPEIIRTPDGQDETAQTTGDSVQIAALDPVLSAEDTAVLDAMQNPRPEPQLPVITEQEAAARYAVTGIWPLAPETPLTQPATVSDPVYRSSLDAVSTANDALALPAPGGFETDTQLVAMVSPPPFGQTTQLDAGGLIIPTPDGVVTPEGYTLIAASPPRKPPDTLTRFANQPDAAIPAAAPSPLLKFRPKNRPLGLAERSERAQLGGVTRSELAAYRPALRPRSIQDRARQADEEAERAKEAEEARAAAAAQAATAAAAAALAVPQPTIAANATVIQNATKYATSQSKRPDTRPRNFARVVKRAERAQPQETRVAAAASVAPRSVSPSIPSKASVARSATVKNAINLRRVNLIGVYGKPSSRRALVRLSNGRYQKVRVGDRIDGGRVSAISNSELRYSKGGRNVVLKMP